MQRKHAGWSLVIFGLLVLTACVPGQPAPGAGTALDQPAAQIEKTLVMVLGRELPTWDARVTGQEGSPVAGGIGNYPAIAHDGLRRNMFTGNVIEYVNLLAAEVPSQQRGTWTVNPDATMDMTWKIIPNAKWHDGTPVTAADFEFAFKIRSDPESARIPTGAGLERFIKDVKALDAHSFTVHWSAIAVDADIGTGLDPLPRHILEPVFQRSRQAVSESRFFTTEFVGTGPFKLVRWEPGSHLEFQRFDGYYRGPAKISRLIVRIIPDPNTMVANMLAGAVDVIGAPGAVGLDVGLELKDRWEREGSPNRVLAQTREALQQWQFMRDPAYARPVTVATDARVRQAMLQAVDRAELNQIMTRGLSEPALTYYHLEDPYYRYVKDDIPRFTYPYDPRAAQNLLTQAGWATRGADGFLVHPQDGRFEWMISTRAGDDYMRQATVIQDYWKQVGMDLKIHVATPAELNDNEWYSTLAGGTVITIGGSSYYGLRLHSSTIPRPENRWTGNNRGRYDNRTVDGLIDRIQRTIDVDARGAAHRELHGLLMGEVFFLPWYWIIEPTLLGPGVTGPYLVGGSHTADVWSWDKN